MCGFVSVCTRTCIYTHAQANICTEEKIRMGERDRDQRLLKKTKTEVFGKAFSM